MASVAPLCNGENTLSKTGSHAGQAPFPEKDANMSLVYECHENSLSASGEETVAGHKSSIESDDNTIDNEIQTTTVLSGTVRPQNPQTSTPLRQDITVDLNSVTGAVGFSPVSRKNTGSSDSTGSSVGSSERPTRRSKRVSFIDPVNVRVPLVGFEVMEQRAKFTVFKLHVHKGRSDNWFVFRRYTDFVQLQKKLKRLFPMFRIPLPPKRWFRNNYDRDFLDDRMHGLQAFIDSVLCHSDLCNSYPVQEFFCFSDPPGPHDSVEESRAYCEELEDSVFNIRKELYDKDREIELLKEELTLYKSQVGLLSKALREANFSGAKVNNTASISNSTSTNSLAECDFAAPEADQSDLLLHSQLVNKQPAQLVSNQSEVSIHQELLEAAAKDKKGKGKQSLSRKENSSKIMKLLPSSSSVQ